MPELNCPKCNTPLSYTEADTGKAIKCTNCGADVLAIETAEKLLSLKCAGCGGAIEIQPGLSEVVCPYCGASYLLPPAYAAAPVPGAAPEYITPFKIFQSNMLEHLNKWLNEGVFTASDADTATTVTKVTAKYVPLYICNCDAESAWSGQNSTTHYRTVTKTRTDAQGARSTYQEQEPYKEWHSASGTHNGHYRVAVMASSSVTQEDMDKLAGDPGNFTGDEGAEPFGRARREDNFPVDKAGFDAEEAKRRARMKVEALERAACDGEVERLNSCSTRLSNLTARLSYHPIWWVTYSYKAKPYSCLMDGASGAVTGKKPVSKAKVAIAIILVVVVIIIIVIIACVVGGGYFATSSALINQLLEGARALV
jgi:DNA-directed RNA polymerase subunit RPC12/RpoP/ABC-type cobalt transport system substrate-binding protein